MGADLNLGVVDRGRRNPATALVKDLFQECALRVREELVTSDGKHIALDNLHAGIPAHDRVRAKQKVELLLERNREWIDFDGRRVLAGVFHRLAQIHPVAGNQRAGFRDLDGKRRDALDLSFIQVRAGRKTPRVIDENAHTEALAVLIADAIDVVVLDADHLLTPIDNANVRIARPLQLRDI